MAQNATKVSERALRYTLNPEDDKLLRFSGKENQVNEVFHTEVIDISASGIAFATLATNSPDINEEINMEFCIPGDRRMAWRGKVVRIDPLPNKKRWKKAVQTTASHSNIIIVGVQFEDLPKDHEYYLNESIKTRLHSLQKHKEQERVQIIFNLVSANKLKLIMYLICILGTALSLLFLAMPESNLGREVVIQSKDSLNP